MPACLCFIFNTLRPAGCGSSLSDHDAVCSPYALEQPEWRKQAAFIDAKVKVR
jgi:hypothetical protein